jgi:3-hydroxyacyl-[acyl-carrier-protein] dehydratase
VSIDIPLLMNRLCYRFPSFLVDQVVEHEPGRRLVAFKNVTVGEDFFQGHFPGAPLMPGVLMIESLAQASALLLLGEQGEAAPRASVQLRSVRDAKFRRQVVPGDRVRLEVVREDGRPPRARVRGVSYIGEQVVAEMQLVLAVISEAASIDPAAIIRTGALVGAGTVVGPSVTIGPNVRIGRNCRIGASTVIDGWTEIGDGNRSRRSRRSASRRSTSGTAGSRRESSSDGTTRSASS